MLGSRVTYSSGPWANGGRVEQLHATHRNLYGIRGLDGHLYWQWLCDFRIGGDLFAPL